MIERRKVALVLLVLGAGLAVVGSFQDTYGTIYRGYGPGQKSTTTLWIVTSEPDHGQRDAYYAAGLPLMIAAVVMAVAVVLMVRNGRAASVGRPLAMGAAGALAGIVFLYVVQVLHEEEIMRSWPADTGLTYEMHYYAGMYLLVAGAVVGLAGAALAQLKQPEPEVEEEEVVVHQLGNDDDTPPFGIAIPGEEQSAEQSDEQQETR